jgi:hypothetical protein
MRSQDLLRSIDIFSPETPWHRADGIKHHPIKKVSHDEKLKSLNNYLLSNI